MYINTLHLEEEKTKQSYLLISRFPLSRASRLSLIASFLLPLLTFSCFSGLNTLQYASSVACAVAQNSTQSKVCQHLGGERQRGVDSLVYYFSRSTDMNRLILTNDFAPRTATTRPALPPNPNTTRVRLHPPHAVPSSHSRVLIPTHAEERVQS
jgi:hypothetical protein